MLKARVHSLTLMTLAHQPTYLSDQSHYPTCLNT